MAIKTLSKQGTQAYRTTGDYYTYIDRSFCRLRRPIVALVSGEQGIYEDNFREAMCALSFSALGTLGIP